MMVVLLAALLLQNVPCGDAGAARLAAASASAAAFDLGRAAEAFAEAARLGCEGADVAASYLRGLTAARAAYAQGGSPESLAPVKQEAAALEVRSGGLPGQAEIARFVLLAASAAAQSERGEMALLIDHVVRLESIQLAAKQPGAPAVTAHEVAGDLWLQVHRYEDARRAYRLAAERVGRTPRVLLGLARTAARLDDVAGACGEYRALLAAWHAGGEDPAEIREARAFVDQPACSAGN